MVSTVNGTKTINLALYHVQAIDSKNVKHVIITQEVSAIPEGLTNVYHSSVKSIFSSSVHENWEPVTSKPIGSVYFLISLDYWPLQPIELDRQENQRQESHPV